VKESLQNTGACVPIYASSCHAVLILVTVRTLNVVVVNNKLHIMGRDSSVGIATRYELDKAGIESR
jgi:hypothetical protein